MKKANLIRNTFVALISACMVWSCAQQADYLNAVPSDTQCAMKINPGAIFDKTALADNSQFQGIMMTANGLLAMAIKDKDQLEITRAVMENPSAATGIDFSKPIVFTVSSFSDPQAIADSARAYMILAVNDANRLGKALGKVADVYESAKGYTLGSYNYEGEIFAFGFNSQSLVISPIPFKDMSKESQVDAELGQLLSQTKSEISNKYFAEFVNSENDFSWWFDYDAYIGLATSASTADDDAAKVMKSVSDKMQGSAFMLSTNAEKGSLKFIMDAYVTEEMPSGAENPEPLFKYLPANSTVALACKYNKDTMMEQYDKLFDQAGKDNYENLMATLGLTFEQMADLMAGGFAFAASFAESGNPEYIVVAAGLTEEIWNSAIKSMPVSLASLNDKVEFTADGEYGIIKTKGMTVTNDLNGTRVGDMVKEGGLAADFTNIDLSELLAGSKSQNITAQAIQLLDYAKTYSNENGTHAVLDITFKDKDKNALETIANFVLNIR